MLHRLLTTSDQDFSARCRLITVVTGFAASAASDLLMAGDYALAYPHSMILCHGVRQLNSGDALTHERAVDLAKTLASTNERFALQLANNCISRLIFRVVSLSSEFEAIRQRENNPDLLLVACFINALEKRISTRLSVLLWNALTLSLKNDILDSFISSILSKQPDLPQLRKAEFEALVLKGILEYEVKEHQEVDWSFRFEGMEKIEEKFLLLIDKHADRHAAQIQVLSDRWGKFFLSSDEEVEVQKIPGAQQPQWMMEKVRDHLQPIWFFFVSVCRCLQEDDFYLTAQEAYWLGLIDEIIGCNDLPSPRILVEYSAPATT